MQLAGRVALVDREVERVERAAAEIGGLALVGDVVRPQDAVRCCDETVARPRLRRGASVLNVVSSVMLETDTRGFSRYAATRTAIRSTTRTVACEWGSDGIRVNALSPQTDSPAVQRGSLAKPELAARILSEIPLGQVGDAERGVGPVAVFLASDAARYVTGSLVLADGGRGQLR